MLRHATGVCNARLPIAVTRPSGTLSSRQQEAGRDRLSRGNLLWCSAKFGLNRSESWLTLPHEDSKLVSILMLSSAIWRRVVCRYLNTVTW
jgi:hypothetical protein